MRSNATRLALLIVAMVGCGETPKEPVSMNPQFLAGQVWTYRTRPGEERSRVVICKVETDPKLGEIVHLHVQGIQLKNPNAPDKVSHEIGHMPYAAEALKKCLGKLESGNATLPEYQDGYEEWREAFENGKAGVWTLQLADAISGMEDAINQ
jgi:hypothetical protein